MECEMGRHTLSILSVICLSGASGMSYETGRGSWESENI